MTVIEIDLKDATNRRLARFAGRIDNLLRARKNDPYLRDTLDLFLGVVYALILAKEAGFEDRTKRSPQASAVIARASQVALGNVRMDGKWIAGFHFNSAVFRAAAVYHRVLKIIVGRPKTGERVDDLRPEADQLYRGWMKAQWSRTNADWIHAQVNDMKHVPNATLQRRKAKFQHAIDSVGEMLDLVEAYIRHGG